DLAHPNLVVRMKAANQLVDRPRPEAIPALESLLDSGSSAFQRMHALWVLERRNALYEARLGGAAQCPEAGGRSHAMRVLSERGELSPRMHNLVMAGLKDADAFVQRAAADALGRHLSPENLRPLLAAYHAVPADDTQLLHTVRMALRNQLRPAENWR